MLFNPAAENVLASSSGDYTIKLWDLEDGKPKLTLKGNDIFTSLSWSANGATLATTSRDKKLRFWDVRQEKPAHEVPGHTGAKNSRVVWMGDHDRVATTGFSKMSERQLALWDTRNPKEPIGGFVPLDSGSGVGMPFWDDGCQILYLAGKGDGNIRYYEYQNDKFEFLSEYRSPNPQRGVAFMPKRGVNTHDNEVMRAFKTVDDAYIEPISFIVPRRAETFQDDIFPPAVGTQPAVSSAEWFDGKTGLPPKISMGDLYDGKEPAMMAAEEAPKPAPPKVAPAPQPKAEPKIAETPAPIQTTPAAAREMPSMKDNKQSMSDMANKFADKDEKEKSDDEESFEEIQKPVERPSVAAARQEASKASPSTSSFNASRQEEKVMNSPATNNSASAAVSETKNLNNSGFSGEGPAATRQTPASELREKEPIAPSTPPSSSATAASAAGGLKDVLNEIRGMLQSQGKQIEQLTSEVAQLKAKVGE